MPKKKTTTPYVGLIGISDTITAYGHYYSKDAIRSLAKQFEAKGHTVELIERDGKLEARLHIDIDVEVNVARFSVGQKDEGDEEGVGS